MPDGGKPLLVEGLRTFEDNESDDLSVEEFRRGMNYALELATRKGSKGGKGSKNVLLFCFLTLKNFKL